MRKFLLLLCGVVFGLGNFPAGAVTIKKAAPVATKQASVADNSASLLPTVIGLVSGIQQLNAQTKELTAECIPTSQEIAFVDNIVKEWAKTGAMSAADVEKQLRRSPCAVATGGYQAAVQLRAGTDGDTAICYDYFGTDADKNMIWYGYPKVGKATYCSDGSLTCSEKNKRTVSDIYDIFNLVDFSEADYTRQEATMAAKLIAKIETCSNAKLSAKKKAMWGEFLVTTIGNVGQKTNTATIMETVGGLAGGGGMSMSSLGSIASQFMDK